MSDVLGITIDDRTIRARKFASQIMSIIGECVSDKDGASSRLIDAAYRADVQIAMSGISGALQDAERAVRAWHRAALEMRDLAIDGACMAVEQRYFEAAMSIPFYGVDPDPLPSERTLEGSGLSPDLKASQRPTGSSEPSSDVA